MDTKTKILTNKYVVVLLAFLCCLLWGSAFPCVPIGYDLFSVSADDTWSIIAVAGLRFTLAGVLAILIGSILNKKLLKPKKESFKKICILATVQTVVQYLFFYIGLAYASSVKASIIEGTSSFVAILIACFIFKQEKFTFKKGIGCLLGLAGIVLVNFRGLMQGQGVSFFGEGFILFSTIAYAFSSSLIKGFSKSENPITLSGYQFMLGGFFMTVVGFLFGGKLAVSSNGILMLLYLGFLSAIAYSLWGILLKYNPVSKIAVFGFMTPILGVVLSAVLRPDNTGFAWLDNIISLFLICFGILVVNYSGKRKSE